MEDGNSSTWFCRNFIKMFNFIKRKLEKEEKPTLSQLLVKREKMYKETTIEILQVLKNVFAAAHEVLDDETNNFIEWVHVEQPTPEHIVILGMCMYPIGYTVTTPDGNQIQINEENREYLGRMIKVGMPIKLAEEGKITEIVQFMKEHADESLPTQERDSGFSSEGLTKEQLQQIEFLSHQTKGKVN